MQREREREKRKEKEKEKEVCRTHRYSQLTEPRGLGGGGKKTPYDCKRDREDVKKKKKRDHTSCWHRQQVCFALFSFFFFAAKWGNANYCYARSGRKKKKAEYDSSVCNSVVFAFPSAWKEREREAERVALLLHPTLRFFFLLQYLKRDELKKKKRWERSPYRKKKKITKIKEI